jgi:hypothetical protein
VPSKNGLCALRAWKVDIPTFLFLIAVIVHSLYKYSSTYRLQMTKRSGMWKLQFWKLQYLLKQNKMNSFSKQDEAVFTCNPSDLFLLEASALLDLNLQNATTKLLLASRGSKVNVTFDGTVLAVCERLDKLKCYPQERVQ